MKLALLILINILLVLDVAIAQEEALPLSPKSVLPPPPPVSITPPSGATPPTDATFDSPAETPTPSTEVGLPKQMAWEVEIAPLLQPFNYAEGGRRDPFQPYQTIGVKEGVGGKDPLGPQLPLSRWDIDKLALIGILWQSPEPRAMFRTPSNQVYILGKGERIGKNNGYIGVIREDEVVIIESILIQGEPNFVTRVIRING